MDIRTRNTLLVIILFGFFVAVIIPVYIDRHEGHGRDFGQAEQCDYWQEKYGYGPETGQFMDPYGVWHVCPQATPLAGGG